MKEQFNAPEARWLVGIFGVTLVGFLVFFVVVVWELFWPYHGLRMDPERFTTTPTEVARGQSITYRMRYCVDDALPIPIRVDRELELQREGGVLICPISPSSSYVIDRRCMDRSVIVVIPDFLPAGSYHLHARTTLFVNPLRRIRQNFESADFEVTE